MPYYAEIDPNTRICHAVTETHSEIVADHMLAVPELNAALTGKMHNIKTGAFEVVAPEPRVLSKSDYLKRFTQSERIAIRNAGKVNDVVNDYIELMNAAVTVDLDNGETVAGLNSLEAATVLAPGRALEIRGLPA